MRQSTFLFQVKNITIYITNIISLHTHLLLRHRACGTTPLDSVHKIALAASHVAVPLSWQEMLVLLLWKHTNRHLNKGLATFEVMV